MILPGKNDAIHKAWLYRVLSAIADDAFLVSVLRFKGGTCAAMRNLIERFSVDLDFDLIEEKIFDVNTHFRKIFSELGLEIKDYSKNIPQFFLKYPNKEGERNTLRIDVTFPPPVSNEYEPCRFEAIDRIIHCQTVESMFANKLVALIERHEKFGSIAGRDLYDLHTFFLKGFHYKPEIILERRATDLKTFFSQLIGFVQKNITQKILDQDLNHLIPAKNFQKTRKYLKQELIIFLQDELKKY